jgi:hypothetical protein
MAKQQHHPISGPLEAYSFEDQLAYILGMLIELELGIPAEPKQRRMLLSIAESIKSAKEHALCPKPNDPN